MGVTLQKDASVSRLPARQRWEKEKKMITHQVFQSCVITRDCDMVVTYQKNSTGQFRFELGGIIKSGVEYVALGISETNKMPGASVMACSR